MSAAGNAGLQYPVSRQPVGAKYRISEPKSRSSGGADALQLSTTPSSRSDISPSTRRETKMALNRDDDIIAVKDVEVLNFTLHEAISSSGNVTVIISGLVGWDWRSTETKINLC